MIRAPTEKWKKKERPRKDGRQYEVPGWGRRGS